MAKSDLEKDIENRFVKWLLKTHGEDYLAIKMRWLGFVGLPDRLIVGVNGFVMWVEFKRPGKVAEPIQEFWHDVLKGYGFNVKVCDSTEGACKAFNAAIHPKGLPTDCH